MMWRGPFIAGLCAIVAGAFVVRNPLLFGFSTGIPHDNFFIYSKHPTLDGELQLVKDSIPPEDFEKYRNHCLRVMSFAKYLMPDFVYEEYPNAMDIVAMALAYHDVALWTDGKLNYLEPSAIQMERHTAKEGVFEESHISIARQIIMEHHKLTDYHSKTTSNVFKGQSTTSGAAVDAIVNAVRKADWTDATVGIIRFEVPVALLEAAYAKIPEAGFHAMLAGMGGRLSPNSFLGQFDVLKILKW
jgi:hypothetical protein